MKLESSVKIDDTLLWSLYFLMCIKFYPEIEKFMSVDENYQSQTIVNSLMK